MASSIHLARVVGLLTLLAAPASPAQVPTQALPDSRFALDGPPVVVRLLPRTPAQMAAFYEARGFSDAAVRAMTEQACFITVVLRNESDTILWLVPAEWTFRAGETRVPRLARAQWEGLWERLAVPQAQRSTFGWTLLPESRDLHPGEPVGGNVTLAGLGTTLTIQARFPTGADASGGPVTIEFDGVPCPAAEATP
jgi:hypothetical protein